MNFANLINACKQKCLKLGVAGLVGGLVTFGAFLYLTNKFIITPVANIFHKSEIVEMPFGKIDLKREVKGQDLPCVGKPAGYLRVFRVDTDDALTLMYTKRGNDLENAYNFMTSKLNKCGFNKKQGASVNINSSIKEAGFSKVKLETYTTSNGQDLQLAIASFEYKKKPYTLISLELTKRNTATSQEDSGSDYNNYNSQTNPTSPGSFAQANDLTPKDSLAQQYNNELKPILSSIFGQAKLTEYNSLNMSQGTKYIIFTYMLQDKTDETKVQNLSNALTAQGYQEALVSISSTNFTMTYKKGTTTLAITGDINSNKIKINIVQD